MNPNSKYQNLDKQIKDIDNHMAENFNMMDKKYNHLKDQILKLTKIIEDEKFQKDQIKIKQAEDFNNLEEQIKNLLEEEQSNMQNFAENLVKKIDNQIENMEKEYKNENENLKENLKEIKENMDVKNLSYFFVKIFFFLFF